MELLKVASLMHMTMSLSGKGVLLNDDRKSAFKEMKHSSSDLNINLAGPKGRLVCLSKRSSKTEGKILSYGGLLIGELDEK